MASLIVKKQTEGRIVTLQPIGELDLNTAPELESVVRETCDEEPGEVVLDLSRISLADTVGVRVLLRCREIFDAQDCGFWVMSAGSRLRRDLERYGVLGALPLRG